MENLFYFSDLFGVAVFAITGALMAGRKSMDLFGVLVIAIVTALGGGTLRDLILDNHPVSWIRDDTYILVASLAAVGTVAWVRLTRPIHETGLLVADAFGLAVFTVIGTEVALQHQVPLSTAVIMGVMTGVAGDRPSARLPKIADQHVGSSGRPHLLPKLEEIVDQLGMAPEPVARQPDRLEAQALGGKRHGPRDAAVRIGPDGARGTRGR